MTQTSTHSSTKTFTRLELLKTEVRIAMRRTTNVSLDQLTKTFDRGLDLRAIKKITIYAVDSKQKCKAQMILEIDWDEHDLQISKGRATVSIDEAKWVDHTAIELDEVINLFNKYVATYRLETKWQIHLVTSLMRKEWMNKLDLVDAEEIVWQGGWSSRIPELPEMKIGCYLATS